MLTPRKLPDGRWQVSLGIVVEDGHRKNPRRQFQTRADALEFCNAEKRRKRAHGEITANADGVKVAQWMELDTKMAAAGVQLSDVDRWILLDASLREAGAGSLQHVGTRALSDAHAVKRHGTVAECHEGWMKHLLAQKRRGRYLANGRNFCRNFIHGDIIKPCDEGESGDDGWKGFGANRQALEITPGEIEAYMSHHPGYFGVISAWLGWAAKAGWLPSNPCMGQKPDQPEPSGVITFTPGESAKLLRAAAKSENWAVLAYLAFSLFGGVRPDEFRKVAKGTETVALLWGDLVSGGLEISPELSKTRTGRVIEAEPVLRKWIQYIRQRKGGKLTGPILPDNWIKDWREWRLKHWGKPWHQDILRHTYGSHHLARSQSLEVTARIMGNSPKVLERHYWYWRTRSKDAAVYWDLCPDKVLKD